MHNSFSRTLYWLIPASILNFALINNAQAYYCDNCSPALAGGQLLTGSSWQFMIAPYLWLPAIDSSTTVNGTSGDFTVPQSKIFANFNAGFELHMEAAYGPWALMLDPDYIDITTGRSGPLNLSLTTKAAIVDGGVFYKIASGITPNNEPVSFEILGGARYFGLSNSLDSGNGFSVSSNINAIAPIVGGRVKVGLLSNLLFWLRADVGGFNVDNVKDTWSVETGLAYAFTPNVQLGIGYRALGLNINKSGGSNSNNMNETLYGPLIGLSFNF